MPGLKLKRGGRAIRRAGGVSATATGEMPATQVPAPCRASRYPSAPSWAKASTTVPRESPRSPASALVEGSRVPAGSLPSRIASRSASSSAAWRVPADASARWRSGPEVVHSCVT